MLTVLVPASEAKDYTLYAQGNVVGKTNFIIGQGVFFRFSGIVVLHFSYKIFPRQRPYRVAVCIREPEFNSSFNCNRRFIPNVMEDANLMYTCNRRKYDYLKRSLYYLEQKYGTEIYTYSEDFWTKIFLLIEASNNRKNFATREHVLACAEIYNIWKDYNAKCKHKHS